MLATFAAGCGSAGYQVWWVARHRRLGGFGVDESTYLAEAFRFHRTLTQEGIGALFAAALDSPRNAPLVPLASVPFMSVFGASTTSALMAQSAFYVVCAVAVAAVTARLAGGHAALVAGTISLGLPVAIISARSLQVSLAVAAFLALAVLALLASRRGHARLEMLLFGAAVGAMIMSRTMAVAFVPGLVVGTLIVVERTRRVAANAVLSVIGLVLVAGPWWFRQFDDVTGYLVSFGYGSGAEQIDGLSLPLRIPVRAGLLMAEVRPLLLAPALIIVLAASVRLRRRRRSAGSLFAALRGHRDLVATAVPVVLGGAALLSSSNLGSSYQMPLATLSVAIVCAAGASLDSVLRRRVAGAALVAAAANLAFISTWRPGSSVGVGGATLSLVAFGGTEDGQAIDFEVVDRRFASSASWKERHEAEREWASVIEDIAATAEEYRPGDAPMLQSFFGENRLVRAPTVALTEEITGIGRSAVDQPARPEGMDSTRDLFAPRHGDVPRLLVIVRTPYYLVDEPVDRPEWPSEARARGWRDHRRIPTPDGGEVLILTYPLDGDNS